MLFNWQTWAQIDQKNVSYCEVNFGNSADAANALAGR